MSIASQWHGICGARSSFPKLIARSTTPRSLPAPHSIHCHTSSLSAMLLQCATTLSVLPMIHIRFTIALCMAQFARHTTNQLAQQHQSPPGATASRSEVEADDFGMYEIASADMLCSQLCYEEVDMSKRYHFRTEHAASTYSQYFAFCKEVLGDTEDLLSTGLRTTSGSTSMHYPNAEANGHPS
ncbi:hypothetical protein BKA63DRAFT_236155 [Paraphoma chrysanthemicola]|nr:hypothetical protein BKA63DRAFT_236155 [Paraphoma chrysanthemicola]